MDVDIILEPDLTPAQIEAIGLAAEGYGVRTLWVSNYSAARDAFMTAVPMALATSQIGIGVLVVSPWEMHPLKIANALFTLNEYSAGRAQLVVSAGGEWTGVMGSVRERRVRAARETIEIIKAASPGDSLNYQGELYRAQGFNARWMTDSPPLVYAGASKPQMFRMAAAVADGLMMSDIPPLPMLDQSLETIKSALSTQQRDADVFRISNFWAWHVKSNTAVSAREARRELILRGWLVRYHLEGFLTPAECDLVEQHKPAFLTAYTDRSGDIQGVPSELIDKLIENFSFAGDITDIDRHVETLKRFAAAGLTEIALRLHDDPMDSLRMIGERVIPKLR